MWHVPNPSSVCNASSIYHWGISVSVKKFHPLEMSPKRDFPRWLPLFAKLSCWLRKVGFVEWKTLHQSLVQRLKLFKTYRFSWIHLFEVAIVVLKSIIYSKQSKLFLKLFLNASTKTISRFYHKHNYCQHCLIETPKFSAQWSFRSWRFLCTWYFYWTLFTACPT